MEVTFRLQLLPPSTGDSMSCYPRGRTGVCLFILTPLGNKNHQHHTSGRKGSYSTPTPSPKDTNGGHGALRGEGTGGRSRPRGTPAAAGPQRPAGAPRPRLRLTAQETALRCVSRQASSHVSTH